MDKDRQEDEVTALSSIYKPDEFSYFRRNQLECIFNVCPNIPAGRLEVSHLNVNTKNCSPFPASQRFYIEYLPPIRLYVRLPHDYPSQSLPDFRLSITWLLSWQVSTVCQKLDDLWQKNKGSEILFSWFEFLKNDLLSFLNVHDCLDFSFFYTVHKVPEYYVKSNLTKLNDARVANNASFLHPEWYLLEYSKKRHELEFDKNIYTCGVCYDEFSGQKCIEFKRCNHVYCRSCMKKYVSLRINEGNVKDIQCPRPNCKSEIEVNQVKDLCPELFEKYEQRLLQVTFDTMSDITYCPRSFCQYPVTKCEDETLATCPICDYSFCVYCRKVYHGVAPCDMTSEERLKLITDYQNANHSKKKQLEKKYGRKQLQTVVEKHLTVKYLKENTKPCPNCETSIVKITGCNKMTCTHCQANFCWLCGVHITTKNSYEHFRDNNTCFGRLFEGIVSQEYFDENDMELFEDIHGIEYAMNVLL